MLVNNKIIFSDNGTLSDLSINLNNIHSGTETLAIVAAQDAIYLGSDLPFNHRYIDVSTANSAASTITVAVWNGTSFVTCVEVNDQTKNSSGACLAQSGILSWVPDRTYGWAMASTTESVVTGLTTLKIYNKYWVKLTFSGNLSGTTALQYVGHRFASDTDLAARYPELAKSESLDMFQDDKTTWNPQHILAAEEIVRDLRKKEIIFSANQILAWEQFTDAAVHKVAQIAFTAFGDKYSDNRDEAEKQYAIALNKGSYMIDHNNNARLDPVERQHFVGVFRV